MSSPAEAHLQTLIEEEKVIKSMLLQIKSKYFQLQLEHMSLLRAQMAIISKCHASQELYDTTRISSPPTGMEIQNVNKVLDHSVSETGAGFYDSILNNLSSDTEIENDVSEHFECTSSFESPSDKKTYEEDLDDPSVMNQFKLSDSQSQSALVYSEVDSSDEESP